jgi:uncharacterized protein (DUF488 family)
MAVEVEPKEADDESGAPGGDGKMKRNDAGADTPWQLATIGYEAATIPDLLGALGAGGVELLVDVRAVARSRRPGFAKTKLAANLKGAGIDYLHLRGLGTPADGRAAARAGRHDTLREIYGEHLDTVAAQEDLATLAGVVRAGRRVCLLCFEADPAHCHRSMVAAALCELLPLEVAHLTPVRREREVD